MNRSSNEWSVSSRVESEGTGSIGMLNEPSFNQDRPSLVGILKVRKDPVKMTRKNEGSTTLSKSSPIEKKGASNHQVKMIEVAPGQFFRLRGAQETTDAILRDAFVPVECLVCIETIFCIEDADFVLCPACKVISAVGEGPSGKSNRRDLSVGLGFTVQHLHEVQEEISF